MKGNRRRVDRGRMGELEREKEGETGWDVIYKRRVSTKRKNSEVINSYTSYTCRCAQFINVLHKRTTL